MQPRLFLLKPAVALRALVNMTTVTYPLDQITFDSVTAGAVLNVQAGMTLLLGSAAGLDDYGRQRVRANTATSGDTILKVGRSPHGYADGELHVVNNAHITVLNDFRVWAKLSRFDPDTGEEYKDSDNEIIVGGQNDAKEPPPKAQAGLGFAGTADRTTNVCSVQFDASDSWQWNHAASGSLTQAQDFQWIVTGGLITSGLYTDPEITVDYPPGFYWARLIVTDFNNKQHTMRLPIYVRDPDVADPFENFQIRSWRETEYGTEIDLLVLSDIPRDEYPDGTLAMLWDDEGPPNTSTARLHMLFVGWIQTEDSSVAHQRTGTLRDTTLHLVDVMGRLKRLPGFSQAMEYAASANHWFWTEFPVVLYYIWYLLHWHSTALELSDLYLGTSTLQFYEFKTLGSDEVNFFEQVNRLAMQVTPDHHFTCHRRGRLMLVVDPLIQFTGDRSSSVYNISDGDWTTVQFAYERAPRVRQLDSYAVTGGKETITSLRCQAPGVAFGQGESLLVASERITDSEVDFRVSEGNRYARLNSRMGPIQVQMPYNQLGPAFSPASLGWIRLQIGVDNDLSIPHRAAAPINIRCLCHEIRLQFEYARTGVVVTANLTLEAETWGEPAVIVPP